MWILALALFGCHKDSGDDDTNGVDTEGETLAEAVIGPDGGTLVSTDGRLTMTVPEGAVEFDTTFTIEVAGDAPADVRLGPAWRLGPADTDFVESIALSMTYADAEITGVDESGLWMLVLDEDALQWDLATPSSLDASTNTLSTRRVHFSTLAYADRAAAMGARGLTSFVTSESTVHVEVTGNDASGNGTTSNPFLTLEKACDAVHFGRAVVYGSGAIDFGAATEIALGAGSFGSSTRDALCWTNVHGAGASTFVLNRVSINGNEHEISDLTAATYLVLAGSRARQIDALGGVEMTGSGATISDATVTCSARTSGGQPTAGLSIHGGVVLEEQDAHEVQVRDCGQGVRLWVGHNSSGNTRPTNVNIARVELTDNDVGLDVGPGVEGSFSSSDVRDNGIGVHHQGNALVNFASPGGNTFACNDLDFEVAAGQVDVSNNFWDHAPPEPTPDGDDISSGVIANNAQQTPDRPCEDAVTGPELTILLQTGDELPGDAGAVYTIDSLSRAPNGDACMIAEDELDFHLVCRRLGAIEVVLTEGQLVPGTSSTVPNLLGALVLTGDDVVVVRKGATLITMRGNTGSVFSTTSDPLLSANGVVVTGPTPGMSGQTQVYRSSTSSGCIENGGDVCRPDTSDPHVDDAGNVYYRSFDFADPAVYIDDGTVPEGNPVKIIQRGDPLPDATSGETVDGVEAYETGGTREGYFFVLTQGAVVERRLYHWAGGAFTRVPLTADSRAITSGTFMELSSGNLLALFVLDGTTEALVWGDESSLDVPFQNGDVALELTGTYSNVSPFAISANGTFAWRPTINTGTANHQVLYLGPLDQDVKLVAEQATPLLEGGPDIKSLTLSSSFSGPYGGQRAVGDDGAVVFLARFEGPSATTSSDDTYTAVSARWP